MPKIVLAEFETSAADPSGWPDAGPPEIAFVGRSNVGKSSLMNVLVERRGLARTSSDPGRTRLINFFRVEVLDGQERRPYRFVDLPGFGYAKVSKTERAKWRPAIERYLAGRQSLRAVVLLVDARRVPMRKGDEDAIDEELDLYRWIAAQGVRVVPVATKSDKLAKHERGLVAERVRLYFGMPPVLFSALSGDGRERLFERVLQAAVVSGE